ncbi:MAG: DNA polymerase III subunit beta [Rhodocyclaceae bacterium]|nr:DNA polymerase III subunit beta [Rhodocyclaceae bacterium]
MLLLKVPKNDILAPLQSVSGVVEKRHTLPILSNVLIEKRGETLTFLATDIELQITTHANGSEGGEDVAVTVGARKLQDILRALPDGTEVSLILDDKRMQVRGGKSRFSLQTLPAADYPRMAPAKTDASFTLSQGHFKALLGLVQYSMAQQDIRYYLNGLLLVVMGRELRAVATDGHRLAFGSTELQQDMPHSEVILPRKTVIELSRLLADSDEPLEVVLAGNQAVFRFGNIELVTKLIDGKFPDYERVIPKGHDKTITLGRVAFLQALQRAAILTSEKHRGVRVVLSAGSLKIISNNAEQEEAQDELEVPYQGDALDIGFNVGYLVDVLNNVSSDDIECHLHDSNSSALITVPGNATFRYVVMPMRI